MTRFGLSRLVGVALVVAGAAWGFLRASSSLAQDAPPPNGAFSTTSVSGYVFDAVNGRSVANAQISSFPATDSIRTNQQGLYALTAGQAFGRLALRAERDGFRQAQPVCVDLKAGQSSFADILMVRSDAMGGSCEPGCREGEECVGGVCATLCAPACGCGEICTAGGICQRMSSEPACGANAAWLGGETCACSPGYVPAVDGASCTRPGEITSCPAGATLGPLGCICDRGLVPSLDGTACVQPGEVIPVPEFDTKVVRTWPTPGALPWGIAFDGTHHFTVDRETQLLYELELAPGAAPTQISTISLGAQAARVTDLAATADAVYVALAGNPPGGVEDLALLRFDRNARTVTPISVDLPGLYGITTDGEQLLGTSSGVTYAFPFGGGVGTLHDQYNFASDGVHKAATIVVDSSNPRFAAITQGRQFSYRLSNYDGTRFFGLFVTPSVSSSAMSVLIPGSHVAGLDAYGNTLWLIVGGAGLPAPVIAEVSLAR
jgi:hypothetical protein